MELGGLVFTAADFTAGPYCEPSKMAAHVNALLRARLEKAPKVSGHLWPGQKPDCETAWGADLAPADTHTARLVCIEPIKGE